VPDGPSPSGPRAAPSSGWLGHPALYPLQDCKGTVARTIVYSRGRAIRHSAVFCVEAPIHLKSRSDVDVWVFEKFLNRFLTSTPASILS
jgi:hypothetical protein